jgi:peptidyl-prolyl cis-trans isomerase SurA
VKIFKLACLFLVIPTGLFAQSMMADKIVGIVGKIPVLYSDIEDQYLQLKANDVKPLPSKCEIFEELLCQKLILNQAEIDSVVVDESEVDAELDQRINYFINQDQFGSEEKLENYFGKTILEIRKDMRSDLRDQLLMQKMKGEIVSGISITPSEVKSLYNSLPSDSIPFVESEVEINQIVIYPASNDQSIFDVKDKLLQIRERILNGESFLKMAVMYSEDPKTSARGGDMGWTAKAEVDPIYAKAAFALKEGQVSKIVESPYGYDIIQLIERTETRVHTRRLLMKPKISGEEKEKAKARLDSILTIIRTNSLPFDKAAMRYSQDEDTRIGGGLVINPSTGNTKFKLEQLNSKEFNIIRNLKVGEFSEPYETVDDKGKTVIKTIRLKSKTDAHKANLKMDFGIFKQLALEKKNKEILDDWFLDKIKVTYIKLNEPYKDCSFRLKGWLKN